MALGLGTRPGRLPGRVSLTASAPMAVTWRVLAAFPGGFSPCSRRFEVPASASAGRPFPCRSGHPGPGLAVRQCECRCGCTCRLLPGTARFLFSARNRSARAKRVPGCGHAYDLRVPADLPGSPGREQGMRPSYRHVHRAVAVAPACAPPCSHAPSRRPRASLRPYIPPRSSAPRPALSARTRPGIRRGSGRPRRPRAPGAVLPCADLEPRALEVSGHGPLSPSDPPPGEGLPRAAAANPAVVSLDGGVLRAGTRFSNRRSIAWRRRPHGDRGPEGGARTYGAAR